MSNIIKTGFAIGVIVFCYGLATMEMTAITVARNSEPKVVKIGVVAGKARFIGSGAIVSADGNILTCAHLFGREGAKIFVKTTSGNTYRAHIVRISHKVDLAVIKIEAIKPLPYFRLGDDLLVGQQVMAFGSPLNIQGTTTVGYVENLNLDGRVLLQGCPTNPGNSGGPLVDMHGNLVGVNVFVLLLNPFQIAQGLSGAVNLSTIREFVRI